MSAGEIKGGAPVSLQRGVLRPGDLDLSDPQTFVAGVPDDYFRVLREQDPVHWQDECVIPVFPPGPGYLALTRYADVTFVSRHPELFSSAAGTLVLHELHPRGRRLAKAQLIQMDPPDHSQLRSLINGPFKPRAVQEVGAHMRRIVCETLDPLVTRSQCDFVGDVSAPISLRVLTRFLGVPDDYTARFYRWTNETTRNAISGGIQALCEHSDQFDRLRRDPSLLPQAIEEILRWVSPVMQFRRTAMRDTQIGNQEIRKGDKVVMYYGAANRDPDEEFLRRFPNVSLAGLPERLQSNFISGIKSLPVYLQ